MGLDLVLHGVRTRRCPPSTATGLEGIVDCAPGDSTGAVTRGDVAEGAAGAARHFVAAAAAAAARRVLALWSDPMQRVRLL